MRTLHEDLGTSVISRRVLLRMRNISDKVADKMKNTHFMSSKYCPKIASVVRMWKNMVEPDRPQMTV
jgi:isochorismate hydrolase